MSVSPRKRSPKKTKKSRKRSSSSSSSSSSESESERPNIIKKRKVFDETHGVSFVAPTKSFDTKKELKTSRRVIKKSDSVLRTVDNNMSISKCRQIVIHRKAEFTTIFAHVDQTKLPKDPEAITGASTVNKGCLLLAMFGGDEEEESDKESDEPEALKAAKLIASKEDRKNTTGIKLNDRITWWAEMNGKPEVKDSGSKSLDSDEEKKKKKKRKTTRTESPTVSRTITMTMKQSQESQQSQSPTRSSTIRSQSSERNSMRHSSRETGRSSTRRSFTRRSPSRRSRKSRSTERSSNRSQSPIIRDMRNFEKSFRRERYKSPSMRSRSRSSRRSPENDEKRKPCVFFFSKEAKGCKWSSKECKFSHSQNDYNYWKRRNGHELPNSGLIHRTEPVYPTDRNRRRSRSFSPR